MAPRLLTSGIICEIADDNAKRVLRTEKSRAKAEPLTTFEISGLNADYGDMLD